MSDNAQRGASWAILGRELMRRTIQPASHVSFALYFFVAVIVLGAAGIWLELYAYLSFAAVPYQSPSAAALRTAVTTFFPALAGTSCMQLIWENDDFRSLRAFATSALVVLFLAALAIAPATVSNSAALWVGCVASCLAFWTWWIANAEQKGLMDLDPDAPMGKKDPKANLSGNLDGFTV